MKSILLILSVLLLGFAVLAEDPNLSNSDGAGWFGPAGSDCPKCAELQIPGGASLGNNKGVFRSDDDEPGPAEKCDKKCRKRKGLPAVDTGQ